MLTDLGTHYDVYEVIDDVRCHVGMSFVREALLGEDDGAFMERVERTARDLRKSGLGNDITTRFMAGGEVTHGCIDIRFEPKPAPLMQSHRGRRSGVNHT